MSDKESKKIKIKSWYSNRYQIVVVQRNILLILTMISIIAVAVSILFVKNMMSSKSLEPYVIEIDEKTGIATTVQQPSATNYTANEVVKRYFVNKFIQSSMSYSTKTYKQDVEIVRLFSSPSIYNEFKKRIDPNVLGGNSSITTKVKSLMFKGPNEIEVRIAREVQSSGTQDSVKNEIIFMTFFFAPDISLSMEERLINPLGFQVIKFEIGEEVYSY
jgi:type IV secretion system protein VirB8